MKLEINGETVKLPETIHTVKQLIDHYAFRSPIIIVEHNETILKRDDHEITSLKDGDKVELVQFVGGG